MVRRRLVLKLRSCEEEANEWPRDGVVSVAGQVNECNILCGIGVPINFGKYWIPGRLWWPPAPSLLLASPSFKLWAALAS